MAASVFVDTNVLLRFAFSGLRNRVHEKECKDHINRLLDMRTDLWISGQVIREFCVQATSTGRNRFLEEPLTSQQVVPVVESFPSRFGIADETPAVRRQFLTLLGNYTVPFDQIHDANIAATMLVNGITTLCTLNRKDFLQYREITLEAPQADPA